MKLSPFKTARATYAFVSSHRLECARILWLPLVLMFLLAWLLLPRIAAPHSTLVLVLLGLLLAIGLTCLASIMGAGLWRLILRGIPVSTPYYLGFGSDELRLLALAGVKALLLLGWAVVAALLTGLVALVAVHLSGSISPTALVLTFAVTLLALAWFGTRLSLSGPATIRAQRVSIAASWHATAHNVARLQRVAALLMAPMSLLIILVLVLLLLLLMWWWLSSGATASELTQVCAAWLRCLWPLALLFVYLLLMFIAALFIVARALEYQEIGPPPGAPI
jgi:hypothetical protein